MVYIVAGLKPTAQMGAVDFKHTSLCVSEPLYPVPALTPCLSVCPSSWSPIPLSSHLHHRRAYCILTTLH